MTITSATKEAKTFLKSVNYDYIQAIISHINFTSREKHIIAMLLEHKTIKEISIELNLSLSYIAFLKQEIYKKISVYLSEEK